MFLALLQRSNSRSASAQNLHTTLNSTKSIEVTKPVDCYVISNTGTAENSPRENGNISGSPTIIQSCVERSLSDGKDYGPSSGIRVTQSFDAFPTKRKHRKANNRYKSCEIDYQVENDTSSDVDGILYTPSTPVIKKKALHRRQKSNANIKDLGIEGRATDTGTIFRYLFLYWFAFLYVCTFVSFLVFFSFLSLILNIILLVRSSLLIFKTVNINCNVFATSEAEEYAW